MFLLGFMVIYGGEPKQIFSGSFEGLFLFFIFSKQTIF